MCGNTTAVIKPHLQVFDRARDLHATGAFLHHFSSEGMVSTDWTTAFEAVAAMAADYTEIEVVPDDDDDIDYDEY